MTKHFLLSTTLDFANLSPHLMPAIFKVSLTAGQCGLVVGVLVHASKAHGFMSPLRAQTGVAGSIPCLGCNQLMCLFHNDVSHSLSSPSSLSFSREANGKKICLGEDQQLKNKIKSVFKYKVHTCRNSLSIKCTHAETHRAGCVSISRENCVYPITYHHNTNLHYS